MAIPLGRSKEFQAVRLAYFLEVTNNLQTLDDQQITLMMGLAIGAYADTFGKDSTVTILKGVIKTIQEAEQWTTSGKH